MVMRELSLFMSVGVGNGMVPQTFALAYKILSGE